MSRRAIAAASLGVLLCGCGLAVPEGASTSTTAAPSGLLIVTAGGTALSDGAGEVPATLDLRVATDSLLAPAAVAASLDGHRLEMRPAGRGVSAGVSAMTLGSAHTLDLGVAGRDPQRYRFHVVPATGVYAALHGDPAAGTVLDLAFAAPPDRAAVERAVPGGDRRWVDDRHLRVAWSQPLRGALELSPSIGTARGSHLAGALHLGLGAIEPGAVRTAAAPTPSPGPECLTVVGFSVGTAASRAALAAHADQLSAVSPTGLSADGDGGLVGGPDAETVAIAREHSVPVWPLLQNRDFDTDTLHRLLGSSESTRRLVDAVRARAAAEGWKGIHLDVEEAAPDDRDALSGLVRDLATALHADHRRLAVAIVPHKPGRINSHSAAYDLGAITRAADLVTVMAYPERTATDSPGPVAGGDWVGQELDGTLPALGGAGHALLGAPVYDLSWAGAGGRATADGYAASLGAALAAPGARIDYDFSATVPFVRTADGSLTYLEDARSLATTLAILGRRGMAGVALWRLGFEDPEIWSRLPATAPRPG